MELKTSVKGHICPEGGEEGEGEEGGTMGERDGEKESTLREIAREAMEQRDSLPGGTAYLFMEYPGGDQPVVEAEVDLEGGLEGGVEEWASGDASRYIQKICWMLKVLGLSPLSEEVASRVLRGGLKVPYFPPTFPHFSPP